MEVEQPTLLVYGYKQEHANAIKEGLDSLCGQEIVIVDGSDKESIPVSEIIESSFGFSFKERDTKIVMFIGFKGSQIEKCLRLFPRGEITRPIFCTLTEQNRGWTLEELIQDLMKKHRAWTKTEKARSPGPKQIRAPIDTLEELKKMLDMPIEIEEVEEESHPELGDVDEDVKPIRLEGIIDPDEEIEDIDDIIREVEGFEAGSGNENGDDLSEKDV